MCFDLLCDTELVKITKVRVLSVARGAYDTIALFQKKTRQVGPVLARYAADQRAFASLDCHSVSLLGAYYVYEAFIMSLLNLSRAASGDLDLRGLYPVFKSSTMDGELKLG